MAIHAHSTPVPAPQRGLLRVFARPPAAPISTLDLLPRSGEKPLPRSGDTLAGQPWPLAASKSTAPQPSFRKGLGTKEALANTALTTLLEPPEAAEARALHSCRRLGEALEYGFALLDALDLPPLALDVIDDAIAHLDSLDAPREDLEPSLGWTESGPRFCGDYQDCELDTADVDAVNEDAEDDDPAEETSLETAGRGFIRCGADDAEDDDGCERGEEYGSDDGEDVGHHASQVTPRPLTPAERAEVAVMAARAATMRRALHV